MQNPLLGLERAASVTAGRLIVETHVDLLDVPEPAMRFYPGSELNGDPTNWWGPNPGCVADMLRAVGFTKVHLVPRTSTRTAWWCTRFAEEKAVGGLGRRLLGAGGLVP